MAGSGTTTAQGGASGAGGTTQARDAGGGTTGSGDAGGVTGARDASPELAPGDASPNRGTDATYPAITGKPTVYLAGDSTVQTYAASQAPQQGWGQRIPELFTKDVAFVNKSIGGRSSKSFIDEGRLTEILGLLKAGDYLFAQWGINDRYQSDPDRYTDPATTFRTYLKQYIDGARSKGAFPVLVTPTPRLDYTDGVFHNGFVDYCSAIKAVGLETNTPVIDLQTMGLALYTRLGYDAVVNTISLAGPDVLHFRDTGAYQMARLVAQGVSDIAIPISPFVLQDKLRGH
jgi:lysophospholipase L1-like esterase